MAMERSSEANGTLPSPWRSIEDKGATTTHVDGKENRAVADWQRRREVAGGGPATFLIFFMIFHLPNFEIQNGDLPAVYNSLNFA
jgi:hypothetical protein